MFIDIALPKNAVNVVTLHRSVWLSGNTYMAPSYIPKCSKMWNQQSRLGNCWLQLDYPKSCLKRNQKRALTHNHHSINWFSSWRMTCICGPLAKNTNRAGRLYWYCWFISYHWFISHVWDSSVITHKNLQCFPVFIPPLKTTPGPNFIAPVSHPSPGDHGTLRRWAAPFSQGPQLGLSTKKSRFCQDLPSKDGYFVAGYIAQMEVCSWF